MQLTVVRDDEAGEVEIAMDYEGLDRLIGVLERMRGWRAPDHEHLYSADWGGDDLTTNAPNGQAVVHHLRLTLVGQDGGRDQVRSSHPVPRASG